MCFYEFTEHNAQQNAQWQTKCLWRVELSLLIKKLRAEEKYDLDILCIIFLFCVVSIYCYEDTECSLNDHAFIRSCNLQIINHLQFVENANDSYFLWVTLWDSARTTSELLNLFVFFFLRIYFIPVFISNFSLIDLALMIRIFWKGCLVMAINFALISVSKYFLWSSCLRLLRQFLITLISNHQFVKISRISNQLRHKSLSNQLITLNYLVMSYTEFHYHDMGVRQQ